MIHLPLLQSEDDDTIKQNKSNEPPRGKINNVVSEQVRHKSGCTVTEAG